MARKLMIVSRSAMRQPRVVIGASGLTCMVLAQLIVAALLRSA